MRPAGAGHWTPAGGVGDLAVAPAWLFDRSVPVPPGLEPLHGILIPKTPRERVEADARTQALNEAIDAGPGSSGCTATPG